MLKGYCLRRCTPPALTIATVARLSSPSKGVKGTHFLDIAMMKIPLEK